MKINRIKNIDKFFKFVDVCNGDVYLISKEGDCINLKSNLSKFFSVANIFVSTEEWAGELEVRFTDNEDLEKCLYMLVGGDI